MVFEQEPLTLPLRLLAICVMNSCLFAKSYRITGDQLNLTAIIPNKVVIGGSYDTGLTIKTNRIPQSEETIVGGKFLMNDGGQGANQAVVAARAPAHRSGS